MQNLGQLLFLQVAEAEVVVGKRNIRPGFTPLA